ncbi:hypothetical protein HKX48_002723, partial [Thoreauomyces humboldtii]
SGSLDLPRRRCACSLARQRGLPSSRGGRPAGQIQGHALAASRSLARHVGHPTEAKGQEGSRRERWCRGRGECHRGHQSVPWCRSILLPVYV